MKSHYSSILFLLITVSIFSCSSNKQPEQVRKQPDTTKPALPKDTTAKTVEVAKPIKYIYLTFDDGPLQGSENIDSIVLAEKLKINVFVVGMNVENSKQLKSYFTMYENNPYIEVYNHSYTHALGKYKKFYSRPLNVLNDINTNEDTLHLRYKIVRLPGRNIWRTADRNKNFYDTSGNAAANLLAENGYKLYGWDTEWEHNAKTGRPIQSVKTMVHEVETRLQKGTTFVPGNIVVLLHDEMFQKDFERAELKEFIDSLRLHNNYEFEHIRFYPASNQH